MENKPGHHTTKYAPHPKTSIAKREEKKNQGMKFGLGFLDEEGWGRRRLEEGGGGKEQFHSQTTNSQCQASKEASSTTTAKKKTGGGDLFTKPGLPVLYIRENEGRIEEGANLLRLERERLRRRRSLFVCCLCTTLQYST